MRKLILLFILGFSLSTSANPKLIEVNKEWLNQPDVNLLSIHSIPLGETEAIQLHLRLVEKTLRARDVSNLTSSQRKNRTKCLDILNKYWKEKQFPKNENYAFRTPIFIDKHNTFCAVGHLMKESGFEYVAQEISASNNLVYVREIKNTKAENWMNWAGLTTEECAWIQPGYAPTTQFKNCGKGTNGAINDLYAIGNELIVTGDFNRIDSSINSLGVAKWRKFGNQYYWEDFSQGLPSEIINGTIRPKSQLTKIIKYNNKYWLGGQWRGYSSNGNDYHLYSRNGNTWQRDSSLKGKVMDFIIFNNDLYAAGIFFTPTGNYFLAKYNSIQNTWEHLLKVNTGNPINVLKVYNGNLILGAQHYTDQNCDNVFSYDGVTLSPMYTGLKNSIYSLEVHQGKLYAAGTMQGADIYNMKYWNGSVWLDTNTFNLNVNYKNHISCLKSINGVLYYGGYFNYDPLMGTYAYNFMTNHYGLNWGIFDSTINDIELFDGKIYLAGKFKYHSYLGDNSNHIAFINSAPTGTLNYANAADIVLYPNPAKNIIYIKAESNFIEYNLLDISGRKITSGQISNNQINIKAISPGVYLLDFKDLHGHKYLKKVFIE